MRRHSSRNSFPFPKRIVPLATFTSIVFFPPQLGGVRTISLAGIFCSQQQYLTVSVSSFPDYTSLQIDARNTSSLNTRDSHMDGYEQNENKNNASSILISYTPHSGICTLYCDSIGERINIYDREWQLISGFSSDSKHTRRKQRQHNHTGKPDRHTNRRHSRNLRRHHTHHSNNPRGWLGEHPREVSGQSHASWQNRNLCRGLFSDLPS